MQAKTLHNSSESDKLEENNDATSLAMSSTRVATQNIKSLMSPDPSANVEPIKDLTKSASKLAVTDKPSPAKASTLAKEKINPIKRIKPYKIYPSNVKQTIVPDNESDDEGDYAEEFRDLDYRLQYAIDKND